MSDQRSLYDCLLYRGYDGYFGYQVFPDYIEYVDLDEWTGGSPSKFWSHQEFYDQFKSSTDDQMVVSVISFLVKNKLVVVPDSIE